MHDQAVALTEPEKLVEDFTLTSDYPRYRIEPEPKVDLSELNPDASERLNSNMEVKEEIKAQTSTESH